MTEIMEKILFVVLAATFIWLYFSKSRKGIVEASTQSPDDYAQLPDYLYYNMPYNLPSTGMIPNYSSGQANQSSPGACDTCSLFGPNFGATV